MTYADIFKNIGLHGTDAANVMYVRETLDGCSLYGEAGNDTLHGSAKNDRLYGNAGNDTINGNNGNDTLDGGAGDDILTGGAGDDVYVFGKGYGNDTVNAQDTTSGRYDLIRLVGLNPNDVVFGTSLISNLQYLTVTVKETGELLTVVCGADNAYSGQYQIQAVEFANGAVMTYADIFKNIGLHGTDAADVMYVREMLDDCSLYGEAGNDTLHGSAKNDRLYGNSGNDTINGNNGNDILDGDIGNDTLTGGAGDDLYLFREGGGQDIIYNSGGGSDTLLFEDINPAELWFGKNNNHLCVGLVGTEDSVTVNNWFSGDNKIDNIQADSMVLLENQLAELLQAMAAVGAPAGVDGHWTTAQEQALAPIILTFWSPMSST
jgi:Ca2+-binding RTX toxin-like protein